MNMTDSHLEHENFSFSKLLLSQDVADIIKTVIKESYKGVHQSCNDGENYDKK